MRRLVPVLATSLLPLALAALADQMPKRKPGLWQMTVTGMPNMPPATSKMCIDAATDAALLDFGAGASKQACSKSEIKSDGKTVTSDAVCNFGQSQMTSHSLTKFTGTTAYHTDIKVHYDPPMMGQSEMAMAQDGKWTGPCPANMQPGDMVGPDGRKMNIKQMMQQQQ